MKKRKQKKNHWILVILAFFFAASGYFTVRLAWFFADIRDLEGDDFDEEVQPREKDPEYPRTNILLLGIDARTPREPSRADSIIILSFDDKTRQASLLSIPRDSRVQIPGRGLDKINHAHAFGGVSLTIKAVEAFLDIPVHYYARINFDGFEKIVNNLGGVTLNVEPHVADNHKQLEPGVQRLNGAQALIYVRDRKSDSDIGRVKRQQKFLKAVARGSLQVKTIARAPQLLGNLGDNLRTNMPVVDMIRVANMFLNINLDSIPQGVIPGRSQMIGGVSYWVVDAERTEELLIELGVKGHNADVP